MVTLNQVSSNAPLIIQEITDEQLSLTLSELGLIIGEEVRITGRAPLGDPICVLCNESLISIRKKDAKQITVVKKQDNL